MVVSISPVKQTYTCFRTEKKKLHATETDEIQFTKKKQKTTRQIGILLTNGITGSSVVQSGDATKQFYIKY